MQHSTIEAAPLSPSGDDIDERMPPVLLARLSNHGDTRRFSAGDILFHQGDHANGLYVLLSGRLRVYSSNANGREVVYHVLEAGEFLGELLLDGGPRSASAQAVTDTECLVVRADAIRSLTRTHPELTERLMLKLIARLRHATRTIHALALEGVFERVVTLLEQCAVVDGELVRVPPQLTQQEIANRVGATREMVNQVVGRLTRDGYLHRDARRRMTIVRPLPRSA